MENNLSKILGQSNPMIDFHKSSVHFATEAQQGNAFSIQIANAAGTGTANGGRRTVVLFPGVLALTTAIPGMLTDGAFNDTEGEAGLSASSAEPDTIATLIAYLLAYPTTLKGIHFQFSDETQSANSLTFNHIDPFSTRAPEIVRLQDQFNQYSQNKKDVFIPIDKVIGIGKSVNYTLISGVTVTMTFYFGGSVNLEMMLAYLEQTAKSYVGQTGKSVIETYDNNVKEKMLALVGGR